MTRQKPRHFAAEQEVVMIHLEMEKRLVFLGSCQNWHPIAGWQMEDLLVHHSAQAGPTRPAWDALNQYQPVALCDWKAKTMTPYSDSCCANGGIPRAGRDARRMAQRRASAPADDNPG